MMGARGLGLGEVGREGWWGEQRCSGLKDSTHCRGLRDPQILVLEGLPVEKPCPEGGHRREGAICWPLGSMASVPRGPPRPKAAGAWQGTPCLPDKKGVSQSREDNPALTVPHPQVHVAVQGQPGRQIFLLLAPSALSLRPCGDQDRYPRIPRLCELGAINLPGGLADNSEQGSCCLLSFRGNTHVTGR